MIYHMCNWSLQESKDKIKQKKFKETLAKFFPYMIETVAQVLEKLKI